SAADRLVADAGGIRRWESWMPAAIGAVAVVLSLFLAAMLWFVHRSIVGASVVIAQGEAVTLVEGGHSFFQALAKRPGSADLERWLSEERPMGLRSVAVLTPDGGHIESQAGGPVFPIDPVSLQQLLPMEPSMRGNRARVLAGPRAGRPIYGPPPPPGAALP